MLSYIKSISGCPRTTKNFYAAVEIEGVRSQDRFKEQGKIDRGMFIGRKA